MSTAFSQSMRSLAADSPRSGGALVLVGLGLLLCAWLGWLFFASVGLYEVTGSARLEVAGSVRVVESPISGRIATTRLRVGRSVEPGEILVILEAEAEELLLAEELARVAALEPQLSDLQQELESELEASTRGQEAAKLGVDEARARIREAEAAATLAREEAAMVALLRQQGLRSESDLQKAHSEAAQTTAAVDRTRLAVLRGQHELAAGVSGDDARLARLRRLASALEGELSTRRATIRRIEQQIASHAIRSSVAGTIGETADLETGSFVEEGERLGTVVPAGELLVRAEYLPEQALARIRPGQSARLRFKGFPSPRYGTHRATVKRVAGETRGGLVRVDLALDAAATSTIPLAHGMPATVEIEVDRVSPVGLLLRRAGSMVMPTAPSLTLAEAAS